ncbi:unnamed protein product, partial [Ectocarpus sp. 8 AP-2014]
MVLPIERWRHSKSTSTLNLEPPPPGGTRLRTQRARRRLPRRAGYRRALNVVAQRRIGRQDGPQQISNYHAFVHVSTTSVVRGFEPTVIRNFSTLHFLYPFRSFL